MTDGRPDGAGNPLLLLDVPPTPGGVQETAGRQAVRAALDAPSSRLLWIVGELGVGKTTGIASVLESSGRFVGVTRLSCYRGSRLEESLYRISDFLRQLGVDDVSKALDQRSSLEAKVCVLLDVLSRHPVVLWWDDIHCVGDKDEDEDVADAGFPRVLERFRELPKDAQGRLVFASEKPPPPALDAVVVDFPRLTLHEAQTIWRALTENRHSACGSSLDGIPHAIRTLPFQLRLLSGMIGPDEPSLPKEFRASAGLEGICDAALARLSPDSFALLEVIAAVRQPLGRQALRELSRADGCEVVLEEDSKDPRLAELETRGLIALDRARRARWYCDLHPAIQRVVEARVRTNNLQRWRGLLKSAALYNVRLGSVTGDIWHYYQAQNLLFSAELFEAASQLTKAFLEEILRYGYFDLALDVLTRTIDTSTGPPRSVALGNLAMVHKNLGDYDKALELYNRTHSELEVLGDTTNVARVLHQIGNILYLKEDLEGALDSYSESRRLSLEVGDRAIAAATKVQIANVLWCLGRRDEAFRRYEEGIDELEGTPNESLVAAVKLQLGQAHLEQKRYLEAEISFQEAAKTARDCDDRRGLLRALRAQAVATRQRREYDQALSYCEEAERTAHQLGDALEVLSCQLTRGDLEKDRTQLGKALNAYLDASDTAAAIERSGLLPTDNLLPLREAVKGKLSGLAADMGSEAYERALRARELRTGADR